MDILGDIWQWLPQFAKGDLPSWLAVTFAGIAMFLALRKPSLHTELGNVQLQFDSDGGPIHLTLELTTYSHAPRLTAKAKVRIGGINCPMKLEPIKAPQNYAYATVNTFDLKFVGDYAKTIKAPKEATVDVRARLSDGSKARLRQRFPLTYDEPPGEQLEKDNNEESPS